MRIKKIEKGTGKRKGTREKTGTEKIKITGTIHSYLYFFGHQHCASFKIW